MYVGVYVCMCVCVHVCTCVCVHMCVCVHVCACATVYVCMCAFVCMYACMRVCVYVCTCACLVWTVVGFWSTVDLEYHFLERASDVDYSRDLRLRGRSSDSRGARESRSLRQDSVGAGAGSALVQRREPSSRFCTMGIVASVSGSQA